MSLYDVVHRWATHFDVYHMLHAICEEGPVSKEVTILSADDTLWTYGLLALTSSSADDTLDETEQKKSYGWRSDDKLVVISKRLHYM